MIKSDKIDKNLKELKKVLEENQQMVRNIDNLKHTEEFLREQNIKLR